MRFLSLAALEAAIPSNDPFEHVVVSGAVDPRLADALAADYPKIESPGSFSLSDAIPGPAVQTLIDELQSDATREILARKLDVDLTDRPTLVTLRGNCSLRDGSIHTDSKSKVVSLLLYLNDAWSSEGGTLRLLKDGRDIESYTVEVPPVFGSMVAFKRSDRSFHGHLPFAGPRRVLQMNYVQSGRVNLVSQVRHRLSALTKRPVRADHG